MKENRWRAVHVINGYGKTSGTIQVQELGCLESPIALTNTLNVGRVQDALVGYILQTEAARGREVRSVNCLVGETNDSEISDIAQRAVGAEQGSRGHPGGGDGRTGFCRGRCRRRAGNDLL